MEQNRIKFNSETFCIVIKINQCTDTEIALILCSGNVEL